MKLCVSGPEGTGKSTLARALAARLELPDDAVAEPDEGPIMARMRSYVKAHPTATDLGVLQTIRGRHPEEYLHLLEVLVEEQALMGRRRGADGFVSSWSPVDAAALALQHCRAASSGHWPRIDQFVQRCVQLADRSYELIIYLDPEHFVAEDTADRRINDAKYITEVDLLTRGLYQRAGIEVLSLTSSTVEDRVLEALPRARNGPYRRIPNT